MPVGLSYFIPCIGVFQFFIFYFLQRLNSDYHLTSHMFIDIRCKQKRFPPHPLCRRETGVCVSGPEHMSAVYLNQSHHTASQHG